MQFAEDWAQILIDSKVREYEGRIGGMYYLFYLFCWSQRSAIRPRTIFTISPFRDATTSLSNAPCSSTYVTRFSTWGSRRRYVISQHDTRALSKPNVRSAHMGFFPPPFPGFPGSQVPGSAPVAAPAPTPASAPSSAPQSGMVF